MEQGYGCDNVDTQPLPVPGEDLVRLDSMDRHLRDIDASEAAMNEARWAGCFVM